MVKELNRYKIDYYITGGSVLYFRKIITETKDIDFIVYFKDFKKLKKIYDKQICLSKKGKNYLIEHSAGSGKTKTIAWLSHGLINKFNREDNRVYDMVIVVSDRKVIDKQLQIQVQAIEKVKGIVDVIDEKKSSKDLKEAMQSGSNIVVTTIHKFPYILDEVKDLPKRSYAVIIDEAHSSQSGAMARKMKQILSTNSLEEAEALERDIDEEVE